MVIGGRPRCVWPPRLPPPPPLPYLSTLSVLMSRRHASKSASLSVLLIALTSGPSFSRTNREHTYLFFLCVALYTCRGGSVG